MDYIKLGYGIVGFISVISLISGVIVYRKVNEAQAQLEKFERRCGCVSLEEDLNGNSKLEKFIEVDGVKYFSMVDGKSVEDTLR